ncbi:MULTISPECIES: glycoside hydrolase family 6 protein [unclassified Curtobacterium]|uniref:glycoside hydrolase family 6 protein n=1 Tax=unclassified Curtobacterium TaxID=257496 RepID=UPI0010E1F582|nr:MULTISPECIES: glycoside hydrolase family 6 protein [unclassified Curtobacterium]TCL72572.1 glycosyl hydrolase family 6 [Curtobacterium sp. PhB128]TCL90533.1 glycosyl hydrolase family 6 [Curtobacterium sp. PhB138]
MPEHQGKRASARRQWLWIAAAVVGVAAVVTTLVVVVPHGGGPDADPTASGRDVVTRKTAEQAFPGGLAHQPSDVNQPGIRERQARAAGHDDTAAQIARIADQPIATWLTNTSRSETRATIRTVVRNAEQQQATPVFVLYTVPDRDCGSYSKGGTTDDAYLPWVRSAVRAMAGSKAVVLVEPDAIAQIQNCERLRDSRLPLLRKAVDALTGHGLTVYLDGGNENRVPTATMADWLRQAGVDEVQGFFTNVSNFYRVDQERAYADELADAIGGDPHFVIDVSRNGQGWRGTWCNPEGAGLGQAPHVTGGSSRLDALLWVKTPGLSDGTCNGGPAAGQWWESYALGLVENRKRD